MSNPQNLAEITFGIDHECGTFDAHSPISPVFPHAVCLADFLIGIRQERHIQIELRYEILM